MKPLLLIVGSLMTSFVVAFGQQVHFQNYSTKIGLSDNSVYCLHEDKKGVIWMGTDHGVIQYDGYTFQQWTTQEGLIDNTVLEIYEDAHQNLWFRSLGGLCYYEAQTGTIKVPAFNAALNRLLNGTRLLDVHLTSSDTLYFSLFYPQDEWFNYFKTTPKDSSIQTIALPTDTNQQLQLLLPLPDQGLLLLGGEHYVGTYPHPLEVPLKKASLPYWILGEEACAGYLALAHQNLLLYSSHYLAQYDGQQFVSSTQLNDTLGAVITAMEDAHHNLWLATDNGILYYENGHLESPPQHLLQGYSTTGLLVDQQGNLWVSTLYNGVLFVPNPNIFYHPIPKKAQKQNRIVGFATTADQLFAASYFGDVYEVTLPQLKKRWSFDQYINAIKTVDSQCIMTSNEVLLYPKENRYRFVGQSDFPYGSSKDFWTDGHSCSILGIASGLLVNRFNEQGHQSMVQPFVHRVNTIEPDANGLFWIGGLEGAWQYHLHTQQITALSERHQNSLFQHNILAIKTCPQAVVFGTHGAGLLLLMQDTVLHLTTKDGLVDDFVYCLALENDSTLWIGTSNGVSKLIIPSQNPVQQLQLSRPVAGLPAVMIKDIAFFKGHVWLATPHDIMYFKNQTPTTPNPILPTYLHAFKVNGKSRSLTNAQQLQWHEQNIYLGFRGINYRAGEKITYAYRLVPLETDWNTTQHTGIQYTNLPSGHYTFQVAMQQGDGPWEEHMAVLKFSIRQHWSHSWWFVGLVGGALLLLPLLYRAYWQHSVRMEKLHLEAEQKALRSQMNPHFIFNAMNSILFFIRKNDRQAASSYLRKFAFLMRNVLEHSKQTFIPLSEELDTLKSYLSLEEQRLAGAPYAHDFEWLVDPDLPIHQWQIPPMLLQPLVENAILHGLAPKKGDRKLTIHVRLEEQHLLITVTDNGIGRAAAQSIEARRISKKQSTGLHNVAQRLESLNFLYKLQLQLTIEDLMDKTSTPLGTSVTLSIPSTIIDKQYDKSSIGRR